MMTFRPWREIKALRVELNAARLSCSAEMKRVNRLAARIRILEGACIRHRAQAAHDQQYIDRLEATLDDIGAGDRIIAMREEMRA